MRAVALLVGTSLLAACGGAGETGINSGGSVASGSGGSTGSVPGSDHTFENPTEPKTYQGNGGFQSFKYDTSVSHITIDRDAAGNPILDPATNLQTFTVEDTRSGQLNQLYAGDATTVRNSGVSITYNPRDAIFELSVGQNAANVSSDIRFQDPVHRTDFGGAREPQQSTPNLSADGIQYLEVASGANVNDSNSSFASGRVGFEFAPPAGGPAGSDAAQSAQFDVTTFFFQEPGTTTRYVTYAGFLRNSVSGSRTDIAGTPADPTVPGDFGGAPASETSNSYTLERGAFVFGEATPTGDVPTSGSGSYSGDFLATSVFNDQIDNIGLTNAPTYFQWIEGLANLDVDFGDDSFDLSLSGTTLAPQLDVGSNDFFTIANGATFNAEGSGNVSLVATGGFVGQFQQAWFTNPDNTVFNLLIAGSSIDGTFYGPDAAEAAGNLRIVGGTPDERIDILGVFTGSE